MASFWDMQEVIDTFNKNKREDVVVSECKRQGKTYIDFRIHAKNNEDISVPTSKGFNLEKEKAKELLEKIINKL